MVKAVKKERGRRGKRRGKYDERMKNNKVWQNYEFRDRKKMEKRDYEWIKE